MKKLITAPSMPAPKRTHIGKTQIRNPKLSTIPLFIAYLRIRPFPDNFTVCFIETSLFPSLHPCGQINLHTDLYTYNLLSQRIYILFLLRLPPFFPRNLLDKYIIQLLTLRRRPNRDSIFFRQCRTCRRLLSLPVKIRQLLLLFKGQIIIQHIKSVTFQRSIRRKPRITDSLAAFCQQLPLLVVNGNSNI
ncbi:hypothetical protein IMSAGC018_01867 [Lachnospiraceae bacterium]|nr:hypothetical protein IMSAGC018_01867 [Lachnospiraceae bacterium]